MNSPEHIDLSEAIALLSRTPSSLEALLEGLPDGFVRATEGPDTWSPYDVVGHLIHAERTDWIPRARHILAGTDRPFDAFDRNAQFSESRDRPLSELLAEFSSSRRSSLTELESMKLAGSDLDRTGTHPSLGAVTLGQLIATWVVHDLDHISQIARVMAKRYNLTVGPWSAYLSILRDRT